MEIADYRFPKEARKLNEKRAGGTSQGSNSILQHHRLADPPSIEHLIRRSCSSTCMFPIRTLTARPLTHRIAVRVTNLAPRASFSAPGRDEPAPPKVNPVSPTNVNKIQAKAQSRSGQISAHFSSSTSPSQSPSNKTDNMASATLPTRGGYDANVPGKFTARKIGAPNTLEHRIYIEKDGVPLSPFHDIPLYANEQQTVLNMIVEIPRWTNAKQEVSYNLYICLTASMLAIGFHMTTC